MNDIECELLIVNDSFIAYEMGYEYFIKTTAVDMKLNLQFILVV